MPYVKIWIHLIFSTKKKERVITKELKQKLIEHINMTISLGTDQTIGKVAQLIKGESSNWINKNRLIKNHFEWQDEYIAVSVSESMIDKVRDYIKNQEEHHRRKSFAEEYDEFIKKYGFTKYLR